MTDKVMDQIGRLAWRTHILCEQAAEAADDAGLPFWAEALRKLGREHAELFASCDEDTCPTIPRGRTQELVRLSMRSHATTGIPLDDDSSDP